MAADVAAQITRRRGLVEGVRPAHHMDVHAHPHMPETSVAPVEALGKAAIRQIDLQVQQALRELDLGHFAVLVDPTAELLAEVARVGGAQGVATVRALVPDAPDVAIPSDTIQAWAREHAASLVGMRRTPGGDIIANPNPEYAITDGTRALIRGTIAQAFDEEWTRAELADALATSYAFSEERAATIAQNEVGRALIEGNRQAWKASGVVTGKRAILGSEHDIDDECNACVDAGVIALDQPFPTGDDMPPFHVNCRCDAIAVVAGEEE